MKAFSALLFLLTLFLPGTAQRAPRETPGIRVLVYTHTNGYRHESIERGVATLRALAEGEGVLLDHTEDSLQFNTPNLARYRGVIFLNTTGDVLDRAGQEAFEKFIRAGGGFMGVHAAADTEYDWAWYGDLVGAYFDSHPEPQEARLEVTDHAHPATEHLEDSWSRFDEWYNFRAIRPGLRVLLRLDETSYRGGTNGDNHPIAWYREFDGGRTFYTGLGHNAAAYGDADFRRHLLGGMVYCLGLR